MQKTLSIICFALASTFVASGQILPNSNQSFRFASAFNPAFTGTDPFTSVVLGYRKQWLSIPESPEYLNLVVSTRLNQPADMIHNSLYVPNSVTQDRLPRRLRMIHSLGGVLVNQKYGIFEELDVSLTYSFQYPLSRDSYLSFGVAPGYTNARTQLENIITAEPDQFIDLMKTQAGGHSVVNLKAGVLLRTKSFYLHGSMVSIWNQVIQESLTDQGYTIKACLGIGYSLQTGPRTTVRPSVFTLLDEHNEMVIDYSVKMYIGSQVYVGGTYRDSGFGIAVLGYQLNQRFGLSYSYEFATGGIRGYSNGSHEVVLGISLANLSRVNSWVW